MNFLKYLNTFLLLFLCSLSSYTRCYSFNDLMLSNVSKCHIDTKVTSLCVLETNCSKVDANETSACYSFIKSLSDRADAFQNKLKLSNLHVWVYSLGSAFFISLAGIWGYLLLPLITGSYRDHVMNVLVGLSFGSLITSSLCQLIPEAYELASHKSNYLNIAIFSMFGLWITSLAQSLATIIGYDSQESLANRADSIKKSPNETTNKLDEQPLNEKTNNGYPMYPQEVNQETSPTDGSKLSVELRRSTLFHRNSFASIKSNAKLSKLAIVILAGDFMNNFMDGISIGAGYSFHLSTGIKLSTAIAFEEYTHKLGDFAIVFQSGISMKRVLFWNYSTSCACFGGVVIGIALGQMDWSQSIFSFASGLFLYIALSNMVPELQNMLNESLKKSKKSALISLLEQHVGLLLAFGVLIATSIVFNEKPKSAL